MASPEDNDVPFNPDWLDRYKQTMGMAVGQLALEGSPEEGEQ